MMRVVTQQNEVAFALPVRTDASDQFRLVPLVYDDEISSGQNLRQVEMVQVVANALELRVCLLKLNHRRPPILREQVLHAPRVARFVNVHLVTTRQQLRRNAKPARGEWL